MSNTYIGAELRRSIRERAQNCCEYCLINQEDNFLPFEVDHIIAEKHGGLTEADNLALSCTLCNKHKGSDIASIDPETGEIVPLYNPRRDKWHEHFQLSGAEFIPLTPKGRVTVRLLQLNRSDRVEERKLLIEAEMFSPSD